MFFLFVGSGRVGLKIFFFFYFSVASCFFVWPLWSGLIILKRFLNTYEL